jgi:small subunit ribosomal protein S18
MATPNQEVRYLNPPAVDSQKKKYCRFKKNGIKYIDYKDANFLLKLVNEQGKLLPRRLTGTSLKFPAQGGPVYQACTSPGFDAVRGRYVEIITKEEQNDGNHSQTRCR